MRITNNVRLSVVLSAIGLPLLIAGCGGGSSGSAASSSAPPPTSPPSVTNADPGGIYTGTSVSSSGATTDFVAIVTETGQTVIFDTTNDAQYAGTLSVTGNNLSGSLTGYAPVGDVFLSGQAVAPFSVSGTINQGISLSGTYSGGGDQGTLSMTDDPSLYDSGSSLSSLVGTWEGTVPSGAIIALTNQSNGSFNGQDTDGCSYLGSYAIINSSFNAYTLSANVTCPNGSYSVSGLATLGKDTSSGKPEILYSVSNPTVSITGSIVQQ